MIFGTPPIVANGLIFSLDAANYRSYTSGSSNWFSIIRNPISGSFVNGPGFSTDGGGSVTFNGVSAYVETGNSILTSNSSYTMGVWARSSVADTVNATNRVMGNADSASGLSGADIIWGYPTATSIYIARRAGASEGSRDTTGTLSNLLTGWHYITVTYDHTGVGTILYGDATRIGSNTNLGLTCSLPFRVGRDGNSTDKFNGLVSVVQLYNRALTAQEVLQNYNALKTRFNIS